MGGCYVSYKCNHEAWSRIFTMHVSDDEDEETKQGEEQEQKIKIDDLYLDLDFNSSNYRPHLLKERVETCANYHQGLVFCVSSGHANKISSQGTVECLDTVSHSSSPLPNLPNMEEGVAAVVFENKLLAIGGAYYTHPYGGKIDYSSAKYTPSSDMVHVIDLREGMVADPREEKLTEEEKKVLESSKLNPTALTFVPR